MLLWLMNLGFAGSGATAADTLGRVTMAQAATASATLTQAVTGSVTMTVTLAN